MKFSIIKNKGYGGLCAMLPPGQDVAAYKKTLFYAGGIILNILTCVVFIGIPYMFLNINMVAKLFFIVLGFIGLFLAFINFLPFISQNNPTDGKIVWSVILKKPFARKLMEINKISSQLAGGIRPRDLQIDLTPIIGSKLAITDILTDLYCYFRALDNNNQEEKMHYSSRFEENIETIPHHALPTFYYEICYVASVTGDEDKAREYYEKAGKILEKDKDINGLRVKAYYEYYINKASGPAALLCEEALAVADVFPIKGQGLMEKSLVKHLMELIENE